MRPDQVHTCDRERLHTRERQAPAGPHLQTGRNYPRNSDLESAQRHEAVIREHEFLRVERFLRFYLRVHHTIPDESLVHVYSARIELSFGRCDAAAEYKTDLHAIGNSAEWGELVDFDPGNVDISQGREFTLLDTRDRRIRVEIGRQRRAILQLPPDERHAPVAAEHASANEADAK